MKKLAIMAILAASAMVASAADVGIRVGQSRGVENNNAGLTTTGITLGTQFDTRIGKIGAELAYDRSMMGNSSVAQYSLVGAYPVATFGKMEVAAKVGGQYIDPTNGANGYAATFGVGASYPVTEKVSLVADYSYRVGQSRVSQYNGNMVSMGVKYSF